MTVWPWDRRTSIIIGINWKFVRNVKQANLQALTSNLLSRNSVFDANNLWSIRLSGWLLYPLKFANHWHKHKGDGEKYFVLYTLYKLILGKVLAMTEDRLGIIIFTLNEKIKNQGSRDLILTHHNQKKSELMC